MIRNRRSLTVGLTVTLSVAAITVTPGAFGDSNSDLLRFIIAEQSKRLANLPDCTYTITSEGMMADGDDTLVPVNSVSYAVRKGGEAYVNTEHVVVRVYPGGEKELATNVWRFVITDKLVADWRNVSRAPVFIYVKSEWQTPDASSQLTRLVTERLGNDPRHLAFCPEDKPTLVDLIQPTLTGDSPSRWEVEAVDVADGVPSAFILRRHNQGQERPDLTVRVDATKGFVITESAFEPYNQPDGYTRVYRKGYRQIGEDWWLTWLEFESRSSEYGEPIDRVVMNFNYHSHGDAVDHTPTPSLALLELPSGILAVKESPGPEPGARNGTLMRIQGDALVSIEDMDQALKELLAVSGW